LGTDDQAYAIHTVTCYPTLPRLATQWDGLCFGFFGDYVGGMAQPVEFPSAMAFELAPAMVCVPTISVMEARWSAAGGLPYLELLDPTDADSELVQTCRTMFLPFTAVTQCMAPMLMHHYGQPWVSC